MDPFKILKNDHKTLRGLFTRLRKLRGPDRRRGAYDELKREFDLHTRVEEEMFYPAVRDAAAEFGGLVQQSLQDHHDAQDHLNRLHVEDELFDERIEEVRAKIDAHVRQEESELFAAAKKHLSKDQLEQLGERMQSGKESLKRAGRAA